MKSQVNYSELWAKKRAELPVDADVQADWLGMQSLLDQHLPVAPGATVKKPRFKGPGFLPTLFIALSAAAMMYLASQVYTRDKHRHEAKYALKPGKLPGDSNQQAVTIPPGDPGKKNSAAAANRPGTQSESAAVKNPAGQNSPALLKEQSRHRTDSLALVNGHPQATAGKSAGQTANKFKGNSAGSFTLVHGAGSNSNNGGRQNKSRTGKPTRASLKPGGVTLNNLSGASGGSGPAAVKNSDQSMRLPVLTAITPPFGLDADYLLSFAPPQSLPAPTGYALSPGSGKPAKSKTTKSQKPSPLDWGLFIAVNTSGSFTPKSQNTNFYGSSPVDFYPGLFATFKLNDSWALNAQARLFSPQTVSTTYTHANQSKVDSNQVLSITATRKIYSVSIPLSVVYKPTGGFFLKAGPVISFPVKQVNQSSQLQPPGIKTDSAYYANAIAILNATNYERSVNFGISAGLGVQFKRWIFDATWLNSLSGYRVSSGLGSGKTNSGTLQIGIGFQLDKVKP